MAHETVAPVYRPIYDIEDMKVTVRLRFTGVHIEESDYGTHVSTANRNLLDALDQARSRTGDALAHTVWDLDVSDRRGLRKLIYLDSRLKAAKARLDAVRHIISHMDLSKHAEDGVMFSATDAIREFEKCVAEVTHLLPLSCVGENAAETAEATARLLDGVETTERFRERAASHAEWMAEKAAK